MPQPNDIQGDGGDVQAPSPDMFGELPKTEETPAPETKPEEKKDFTEIPQDHPTIVALNKQIDEIKREYGGNLAGQREVIKRLENQIREFSEGGAEKKEETPDLPFPEIKWSKDLTDEERGEMTDTEIKQMDEIAKLQQMKNDEAILDSKKAKEAETQKVESLESSVKSIAMEIARGESDGKDNVELANQIIESAKLFNLQGLDMDTLKARIASARALLPDYTPPKEQEKPNGAPVKTGVNPSDPHGVEKFVEQARTDNDGSYDL